MTQHALEQEKQGIILSRDAVSCEKSWPNIDEIDANWTRHEPRSHERMQAR